MMNLDPSSNSFITIIYLVTNLKMVVYSNTHINPDDYNIEANFTFFTYHLPDDNDFNFSMEYWESTDKTPLGGTSYNSYDIIGDTEKAPVFVNSNPPIKFKKSNEQDKIEDFLAMVEEYEDSKANCKPGTEFNLGSGVIKQYGLNRFKSQAMIAVNRANFLTRLWKVAEREVLNSEYLLYAQVRSIVESDPEIFAAGNCYDKEEFKDYYLFCPFAYRLEDGRINVKDLSLEYDYLGNTSEFFISARKKAARLGSFNITK
ncbi:unnamed protein product, partial [Candidula unifasciata]